MLLVAPLLTRVVFGRALPLAVFGLGAVVVGPTFAGMIARGFHGIGTDAEVSRRKDGRFLYLGGEREHGEDEEGSHAKLSWLSAAWKDTQRHIRVGGCCGELDRLRGYDPQLQQSDSRYQARSESPSFRHLMRGHPRHNRGREILRRERHHRPELLTKRLDLGPNLRHLAVGVLL